MNTTSIEFHLSRNKVLYFITTHETGGKDLLFVCAAASAMISVSANFIEPLLYSSVEYSRFLLIIRKSFEVIVVMQHMSQSLSMLKGRMMREILIILFEKFMIPNFEKSFSVLTEDELDELSQNEIEKLINVRGTYSAAENNLHQSGSRSKSVRFMSYIYAHFLRVVKEYCIGLKAACHFYGISVGTLSNSICQIVWRIRAILRSDSKAEIC